MYSVVTRGSAVDEPSIKSGALSVKQHERAGDGSLITSELKDDGGKPGGVQGDGGVVDDLLDGEHRHEGGGVEILFGWGEHCLGVD